MPRIGAVVTEFDTHLIEEIYQTRVVPVRRRSVGVVDHGAVQTVMFLQLVTGGHLLIVVDRAEK